MTYPREVFRCDDEELLVGCMTTYPLATVATADAGTPLVSHVPTLYRNEHGRRSLIGHVVRTNPQVAHFEAGAQAVVTHRGAGGYVSPVWYERHPSLPTWNYVAAFAYGSSRLLAEDELRTSLADLVRTNEERARTGWSLASARGYADELLPLIVGFEVTVSRLEGTLRLSQNRSESERTRVASGLRGQDEGARDVARWMAVVRSARSGWLARARAALAGFAAGSRQRRKDP